MKPREALNLAQLQLLLQLPELAAQPVENPPVPIVAEHRPPVAGRKNRAPCLPEHLPLVEEVIDSEPVKAEPETGAASGRKSVNNWNMNPAAFCAAGSCGANTFIASRRMRCR